MIEKELKEYLFEIETFDKESIDGDRLHAYLIRLTNIMARANTLMAEYQKKFREEKKAAYYKLKASEGATNKYFSPMLAKDFIDAQCSETGYLFDLAERTSRTCTHVLDAVRTIVSSLKQEKIFAQYQ